MARILIVDDEPEIVMLAEMMLKKEGHETDNASGGSECLEKLKKEKYDLLLLDVMMPKGIDGWEVCEKVKADEKTKDMPVVMFTVRTSDDSMLKGRECGAAAQVNKPFGIEELTGTISKVLKGGLLT